MNASVSIPVTSLSQQMWLVYFRQNLLAALLIALVVGLFLLLTPGTDYQPRGIVFPWQKQKANDDQVVAVLTALPSGARVIGNLRVELAMAAEMSDPRQRLTGYARLLAASIGGNGVIVTGYASSEKIYLLEAYVVKN